MWLRSERCVNWPEFAEHSQINQFTLLVISYTARDKDANLEMFMGHCERHVSFRNDLVVILKTYYLKIHSPNINYMDNSYLSSIVQGELHKATGSNLTLKVRRH
jgi:hypothetical protein